MIEAMITQAGGRAGAQAKARFEMLLKERVQRGVFVGNTNRSRRACEAEKAEETEECLFHGCALRMNSFL
jgi:hypothetical protein